MILPGAPPGIDAGEKKEWTLGKKVKIAAERGAVGLILMDPTVPGQRLSTYQQASSVDPETGRLPGTASLSCRRPAAFAMMPFTSPGRAGGITPAG